MQPQHVWHPSTRPHRLGCRHWCSFLSWVLFEALISVAQFAVSFCFNMSVVCKGGGNTLRYGMNGTDLVVVILDTWMGGGFLFLLFSRCYLRYLGFAEALADEIYWSSPWELSDIYFERRLVFPWLQPAPSSTSGSLLFVFPSPTFGETARNSARPVTFDIYFGTDSLVRQETLVDLVTRLGSYLPELEYVSLVTWRTLSGPADETA